jgi:hypothetical protein
MALMATGRARLGIVALCLAAGCGDGVPSKAHPEGGAGHPASDGGDASGAAGAAAGSTGAAGVGVVEPGADGAAGGGSVGTGGSVGGAGSGADGAAGAPGDGAPSDARDAEVSGDAFVLPPLKADGPWLVSAIGDHAGDAVAGMLQEDSASFTIHGTGSGVGGTADSFFYGYQWISGDGEIVARIQALLKVSATAQVGIMLRANDTDPGAAQVFLSLDGTGAGGHLISRLDAGAAATSVAVASLKAAQLLRLTRTGKVVTASLDDGAGGWTQVGAIEATFGASVVVGLAATDGSPTTIATAAFDVAHVSNLDADPTTKGWVLSELGTVGGSAIVSNGVLGVAGLGVVASNKSDVGLFALTAGTGVQTITAKVLELAGASTARVGVMVREGSPTAPLATAAYGFMGLTLGHVAQAGWRFGVGGVGGDGYSAPGVSPPVWLKLEKRSSLDGNMSVFTGFYSLDGTTWNLLDTLTFPFQTPFSMGIYLLANDTRTFAAARLTDLTIALPK